MSKKVITLEKLNRFWTKVKTYLGQYILKTDIVNTFTSTDSSKVAAATTVKTLKDEINQLNTKIKTLKTAFVTDSCVTDTNNSGMQSYPYRGTIWGNAIIQQVDSLISQGYTVLGGALVQGPLNDSEAGVSYGMGHGIILQIGQYKNVPTRFTINSTAYQTMRVTVMILYQ